MTSRREFIAMAGAAAVGAAAPKAFAAKPSEVRAMLLHPGRNMWGDWKLPEEPFEKDARKYCADHIRFDETIWREVTAKMSERGLNMVVMDLGEFMEFPSHPELAVKDSWSPERMRKELERLRGLGLEPIPKLNFSATHDQWLKIYHRMLSTPVYRQVMRDVIRDTVEIFGTPRFFHLGWDEERALYAYDKAHFSMRQGELWWYDFLYSVKCVEDCGSRAWVWSDFGWEHKSYYKRCPKSVVQSNWYYDEELGQYSLDPKINRHAHRLVQFHDLDKAGFDQIPCGTNWSGAGRRASSKVGGNDIIGGVVKYCRENVSKKHLLGFLMAPWRDCATRGRHHDMNMQAIDLFAEALA